MLVKAIIIFFLLIILYSLGSALYYLVRRDQPNSVRVVKALSWRIALSLLLFVLLFIAYACGWIAPHAV